MVLNNNLSVHYTYYLPRRRSFAKLLTKYNTNQKKYEDFQIR